VSKRTPTTAISYASKEIHHAHAGRTPAHENPLGAGESGVSDMVTAISAETELAYTSVLTTIRILRRRATSCHRKRVARSSTAHALENLKRAGQSAPCFAAVLGNSRERLLLSLLGDGRVTPEELNRLRVAIAKLPDEAMEEK